MTIIKKEKRKALPTKVTAFPLSGDVPMALSNNKNTIKKLKKQDKNIKIERR